jgi:DNA-directed RNA polymerase specialized sigma24 family protein
LLEEESVHEAPSAPVEAEEFEAELQAVVTEAYPTLCQRVEKARFAHWHRRQSLETDLAHHAIVLFTLHCRKHQRIPDHVLAYLVKIAKNLARRALKGYLTERDAMAEAKVDPASYASALIHREEEMTSDESPTPAMDARLEYVRVEIERLPRRQRQAIELWVNYPEGTQRELGEKMGIGEDGFQKNFTRGIERIRQSLILQAVIERTEVED